VQSQQRIGWIPPKMPTMVSRGRFGVHTNWGGSLVPLTSCVREEMMFAKNVLLSILTAGVVMFAVRTIPPTMGLAPRESALSGEPNP
jgi:hypothetical protein